LARTNSIRNNKFAGSFGTDASYKLSITTQDFFILFIDLKKGALKKTRGLLFCCEELWKNNSRKGAKKIKTPRKFCGFLEPMFTYSRSEEEFPYMIVIPGGILY
jgi:hypothetical protein